MCVVISMSQSCRNLQGFEFEQTGSYFYNWMSCGFDELGFSSWCFATSLPFVGLIDILFDLSSSVPHPYAYLSNFLRITTPAGIGHWSLTQVTLKNYFPSWPVGPPGISVYLVLFPEYYRSRTWKPSPSSLFTISVPTKPVAVKQVLLPLVHDWPSAFQTMNDEIHPKQPEFGTQNDAYEGPVYHGDSGYFGTWMRPSNANQGQVLSTMDTTINIPATNAEANMNLYSFAQNLKTGLPQTPFLPDISEGDRAALGNMRQQMMGMHETSTDMASQLLPNTAFSSDGVASGYFDSPRVYSDGQYGFDARIETHVAAVNPSYPEYGMQPNAFSSTGYIPPKDYNSIQKEFENTNRGYDNIHSGVRNSDPGLRGSFDSDFRSSGESALRSSIDNELRSSVDSGLRSSIGSTGRASVLSMQLALTSSIPTVREYTLTQWPHAQERASYMTSKQWHSDSHSQGEMSPPIRPALWNGNNTIRSAPEVMIQPFVQNPQLQESYSFDSPQIYQGGNSPTHTKVGQENCCPDHTCLFHHEGFKFRWLLRRHICNHHLKSYNSGRVAKYDNSGDLMARFLSLVYVCPVAGCSRAFYRLDSLLRHQRLIHAQTKEEARRSIKVRMSPPEDIFEWRSLCRRYAGVWCPIFSTNNNSFAYSENANCMHMWL